MGGLHELSYLIFLFLRSFVAYSVCSAAVAVSYIVVLVRGSGLTAKVVAEKLEIRLGLLVR